MANALIISKQTGGYFSFNLSIDGVPQDEVRSIQNDLLTVGNTLHFKTSNGANIIKQQNIVPAELTIIASGTFTFATVTQVWDKLIEVGFFDWLGTGGGAGVDRFDDLLDTFQYFGKDGYVCVVNESQQKLEAVPFYNYRRFTELEDTPSYLVPNKMVVVNPAGTSLILQDQPPSPDTYLNSVGYFDYNDSVTHTTPLTFVASTPKKLTNDTLGVNTNTSQNPYGVSYVWNSTTNQFDFSQLSIGDTVDIRIQVQVTTTTANQKFKITGKFGIGSVAQFENTILSSQVKTAGLEEISFVAPFYIGSTYIRDFPAELYITSDNEGTVTVDGWYVRILRKNINILTIESSVPDATTLVKGIVRLGGDLSGTADNPTVPALATKIGSSRLINTTAPLSGGGDLSVDRTISIPQANTSTNGYLAGGDWTTFNNKQGAISFTTTGNSGASTFVANALNIPNYTLVGLGGQPLNSNLTSVSSLSYVSPAFVKMTGLNTFTLDTNTYLTSTTGVTTFSAGTTGLTPNTATSGAITLNGTLVVANGGTGSTTASGARTNLGGTTVGSNIFTSTNPTAITFLRANADNTVSWLDASTFRTAIGAGTSTVTPSALTKVDDTNVTLTLGGTPATSLLQGVSLTLGWTGTLADGRIASATTWNSKQAGSTNLTSLSGLTFASTSFVKMTGLNTFTLDTTAYANDANVVHLTGNETIRGEKLFNNTLANLSKIRILTSSDATTSGLVIANSSATFAGISAAAGSAGATAIEATVIAGGGNAISLKSNQTGSGGTSSTLLSFDNISTGNDITPIRIKKQGAEVAKIDYLGNITGASFIKTGGLSTEYLKADGSVDNTVYATATGGTGYIQNQNASAQTANMWISGIGKFAGNVQILNTQPYTSYLSAGISEWKTGMLDVSGSTFYINANGVNKLTIAEAGQATFSSTVTASNGTLIGGTGTANYLPRFTGTNSLGNSLLFDNGNQMGIGTAIPNTRLGISWNASATSLIDLINTSATGQSGIDYYNSTGINVGYIGTFNSHAEMSIQSLSASGNLTFRTNALERMRILSSGNVGIGNSVANTKLHLSYILDNDGFTIENTNRGGAFLFNTSGINGERLQIGRNGVQLALLGADYTTFSTGTTSATTERMRILSSGNVGVGTTNPVKKFVVSNAGAEGIEFGWSGTNNEVTSFSRSSSLYVPLRFDALDYKFMTGDVRIGMITAPYSNILNTQGGIYNQSTAGAGLILRTLSNGTTASPIENSILWKSNSPADVASINVEDARTNVSGVPMIFSTRNNSNVYAERFRIDNLGNVGFGTTTPIGKVNIFTGTTGITDFNIPSQQSGSISFSNIASTSAVPAIVGKSNDNTGLYFISATNNTNTNADLEFNVRENDNTDFATLTTPAFRYSRFGTVLMDVLRNGNVLIGTTTDSGNKLRVNGTIRFDNLAGTGTRTVVADASGNLSTTSTSNPNYKVYTALLSQTGTSAPTATVLENTLGGTVILGRTGTGNYTFTLTGAFTLSKTFISFNFGSNAGVSPAVALSRVDANFCRVQVSSAGVDSDNIINGSFLEIRIYN